jgi:hypothetical protein
MGWVRGLAKAAAGAGAGVALVTALPVFGAVGTITAVGLVVGSLVGAAAGALDEVRDHGLERGSAGPPARAPREPLNTAEGSVGRTTTHRSRG